MPVLVGCLPLGGVSVSGPNMLPNGFQPNERRDQRAAEQHVDEPDQRSASAGPSRTGPCVLRALSSSAADRNATRIRYSPEDQRRGSRRRASARPGCACRRRRTIDSARCAWARVPATPERCIARRSTRIPRRSTTSTGRSSGSTSCTRSRSTRRGRRRWSEQRPQHGQDRAVAPGVLGGRQAVAQVVQRDLLSLVRGRVRGPAASCSPRSCSRTSSSRTSTRAPRDLIDEQPPRRRAARC